MPKGLSGGLDETHYASVLNFFYFLLLDEGLALSAAYKSVRAVQADLKDAEGADIDRALIARMAQVHRKYRRRRKHHAVQPPKSEWQPPNDEALGAWKEYMRHGDIDSGEALVLRYILKYPVDVIARGLGVPEGTVYYRLGRGLESFSKIPQFKPGAKR